jgi:hypothetical protein
MLWYPKPQAVNQWKMTVIGIALPDDIICHTFSSLGVTAEKHSDLKHVCSLNLTY